MSRFALLATLLLFFGSCIKSEPVRPISPFIVKTPSAFNLPSSTISQISANVIKFCQIEGRDDVSRMVIQLNASNEVLVVYLCLGDPGGVGEDGDGRPVPYAVHKIDNVTYTNFRSFLSK